MKPLRLALCLLCLPAVARAQHCGVERWDIKTLVDSPFTADNVTNVTVEQLIALRAPDKATLMKAESTRFPEEKKVYTLTVAVLGFKEESDSDFHIVIANPTNQMHTMIAEIPAGNCVPDRLRDKFDGEQGRFIKEFGQPTKRYKRLAKPVMISITGVGFFDFLHGQTGVAPNGFELHPVLDWKKL